MIMKPARLPTIDTQRIPDLERLGILSHAGSELQPLHRNRRGKLFKNLHAAPKGDMVFNRLGRFLRLRVGPCGIFVGLIADTEMIVTRDAFPWAGGVFFTGKKSSRLMESGGK
jgi:hypothetical protein